MTALFTVAVNNERFAIAVAKPATAELMRDAMAIRRHGVIRGLLVRGDGGFNFGHDWHLDPTSIELPDSYIELCDGRPSDIDRNLKYWLDTVRQFCPWGCQVISEDA